MKKTNFNKKLSLNKRTLTNLNARELHAAKGGEWSLTIATCYLYETCPYTCENTCDCDTNQMFCTYSCGNGCYWDTNNCQSDYC